MTKSQVPHMGILIACSHALKWAQTHTLIGGITPLGWGYSPALKTIARGWGMGRAAFGMAEVLDSSVINMF